MNAAFAIGQYNKMMDFFFPGWGFTPPLARRKADESVPVLVDVVDISLDQVIAQHLLAGNEQQITRLKLQRNVLNERILRLQLDNQDLRAQYGHYCKESDI